VIGFAKKKKNLLPKIEGIRKKWYITIFIEKNVAERNNISKDDI
jgi:hypothetical protein